VSDFTLSLAVAWFDPHTLWSEILFLLYSFPLKISVLCLFGGGSINHRVICICTAKIKKYVILDGVILMFLTFGVRKVVNYHNSCS
jgi:hypothetical protein